MIGVPLTVMVSPAAKSVASESVAAAPESSVAPVIGAGTAALLLTALPPIVADGLKKSSEAWMADAATSAVSPSVWIEDVSAACKLAVVATVSTPIANEPAGTGVAVVGRQRDRLGGAVRQREIERDLVTLFGLAAPRSTVADGGTPAACVTVAPVNDEVTGGELETECRTVFGQACHGRRCRRRGHREVTHVAGALIGLPALVDQLRQTCLRAVAVEHDVAGDGGRPVGGAARKQIAVAGLAVEQRYLALANAACAVIWPRGLAVVVEYDRRRRRPRS